MSDRLDIIRGKAILFVRDNFPADDEGRPELIYTIEMAMLAGVEVALDERIVELTAELHSLRQQAGLEEYGN